MTIFLLVLFVAYVFICIYVIIHWNKDESYSEVKSIKPIQLSIIIPFRNEENNLAQLIRSIHAQSLDTSNWEALYVDDHSTDNSAGIVQSKLRDNERYVLSNGTGKKAALKTAMHIAKYDHIVQTDADTSMGSNWLESIYLKLCVGNDFITGMIKIENPKTILDHLQSFDLMAIMAFTCAGIQSKKWYLANGANMAYPKDLYHSLHTATTKFASGDDMFLIEAAVKNRLTIGFNKNENGVVATQAEKSISSLIHQRLRWASKNSALGNTLTKIILLVILLTNMAFISFPFIDIRLLWLIIPKMIIDYSIIQAVNKICKIPFKLSSFIICSFLYPLFYTVISVLYVVKYPISWKSRKV